MDQLAQLWSKGLDREAPAPERLERLRELLEEVRIEADAERVTRAWVNAPLFRGYEQIMHGKDPRDRNIRIAPTLPPIGEVKQAMELLCICVLLVSVEKLLG